MSPSKFRNLSLEERLSYCEANQRPGKQRDCLAMARTEPGYPKTASAEDIKFAADLCRAETRLSTLEEMSQCVAWKLSLAEKKPGPDYRRRHLQRAAEVCIVHAPSVVLANCISNTMPYVLEEDYARYRKVGN